MWCQFLLCPQFAFCSLITVKCCEAVTGGGGHGTAPRTCVPTGIRLLRRPGALPSRVTSRSYTFSSPADVCLLSPPSSQGSCMDHMSSVMREISNKAFQIQAFFPGWGLSLCGPLSPREHVCISVEISSA